MFRFINYLKRIDVRIECRNFGISGWNYPAVKYLTLKTFIAFIGIVCSFAFTFTIRGYFKATTADPAPPHTLASAIAVSGEMSREAEDMLAYVKVPEDLPFAGEPVPWHIQPVRRRYAEEAAGEAYWLMPSVLLEQDRNNMYYECRRILREEKVPVDFVYLFMAESTLRNRVSPKGAAGVCQMMPDAARTFGLEVNNEVDERYHFEKAVRAACAYLKKSHGFFDNWTMAAAAYNHGYNGMLRKRAAHPGKSYYEMPLNAETSRYMYRILCIKEAMRNPTKFGYAVKRLPKSDMQKLKVDTAITNLKDFAQHHGVEYADLKRLNPWLVSDKLSNPERKTYTIQLPVIPVLEEQEDVHVPVAVTDTQSIGNIQQRLFKFRAPR